MLFVLLEKHDGKKKSGLHGRVSMAETFLLLDVTGFSVIRSPAMGTHCSASGGDRANSEHLLSHNTWRLSPPGILCEKFCFTCDILIIC